MRTVPNDSEYLRPPEEFPPAAQSAPLPPEFGGAAAQHRAEAAPACLFRNGNAVQVPAGYGRLPGLPKGEPVDHVRHAQDFARLFRHTAAAHIWELLIKVLHEFGRVFENPGPEIDQLLPVGRKIRSDHSCLSANPAGQVLIQQKLGLV